MAEELDPGVPVLAETALADRIERSKPVLVLFYADWCPFCESFVPIWRERLDRVDDAAAANVSHPEDPRWTEHEIEAIPTIIAFEDGREKARLEAREGQGLDESLLDGFLADLQSQEATKA